MEFTRDDKSGNSEIRLSEEDIIRLKSFGKICTIVGLKEWGLEELTVMRQSVTYIDGGPYRNSDQPWANITPDDFLSVIIPFPFPALDAYGLREAAEIPNDRIYPQIEARRKRITELFGPVGSITLSRAKT